jgi:signal transduction histidine kinase/ActR/RegA family two-component response regulator
MDGLLQQIPGFAVWGSFASTVVLGSFLLIQAAVDPARRRRFLLLSASIWFLASLDFLRSVGALSAPVYEKLRIVWCGTYAGAILHLFEYRPRSTVLAAVALPSFGFAIYFGVNPDVATTAAYPLAFGLVAGVHAREYLKHHGYASAILAASSASQAIMCALYYLTLATRNPAAIWLGYLHYAVVSILSVLLGWVHLPREIRGRSPVTMSPAHVRIFGAGFALAELVVQAGLLFFFRPLPGVYLAGTAAQLAVALTAYFMHRHALVIHADNVGLLLEERTALLRQAQAELARQNDRLAERLAEQERDLRSKTEVIDRQRRLELAAQTAGQVAHDIQNLISPLLSRLEDLEDAKTPAEFREVSKGMRTQVGHLLDLNAHLLALSRRGRVEHEGVYLPEVVRDVASRFPGQRLTLEGRGEPWVKGSFSQLARALSNLLANAFESDPGRLVPATVRWGTVQIAQSRRCHLGFLSPGGYSTLEVEDQGPGIPREHLERIFEPFFSLKGSRHRSGSGLGLTIVAAVMDDHRGVLDLDTGSGGTRVTLYIPSIPADDGRTPLDRVSYPATVLVVDDDTSVLKETGDALRESGYTVVLAEGGTQAIRAVQAQPVDLVLLDFDMPRMNGLETFFGALHVRPGVRAVVHAAYVPPEEEARLRALGVRCFLQKPAGRLEILRALHQAYEDARPAAARGPR